MLPPPRKGRDMGRDAVSLKNLHPETLALHGGYRQDDTTGAVAVPIYQTTSYQFRGTQHAENLFALKELGNIYTRIMNPTTDVLERRLAAMEGGAAALALSSGQAATTYSVLNLCSAGDNFVSSTDLYGGTWNLFANTISTMGIEVRYVDPSDPEGFRRATDARTRCYYAETLPNPKLNVFPIREVADIGRELGVPLIVDNTAAPVICRPLEHGAAIVMYSTTKYIGGHGTGIGGIMVDSGKFDWASGKFPLMSDPDASYHGLRFAHDLGPLAPIAYTLRMRLVPLRNLGACISPDNAWMFLQGIETLHLRMQRHCENAMKVAEFLVQHGSVEWVRYPGLEADRAYPVAKQYLKNGFGAMVVFGIRGGAEAGKRFIERLQLFSHLANVGDAKSLAIHPASTTHSQLSERDLEMAGISPGLVRLAIGIEDAEDIINDLKQALD